jgi:2',3'-cyclic-nucleotide 2'-phosphodiesterase (5'-nucleotidase family)
MQNMGGVARRASFTEKTEKEIDVLLLDAGDIFFRERLT